MKIGDFEIKNHIIYVDFKNKVSNLLGFDLIKYFNVSFNSSLDEGSLYDCENELNFDKDYDDSTPEKEQGKLYLSLIPKYRRRFKNIINLNKYSELTIEFIKPKGLIKTLDFFK